MSVVPQSPDSIIQLLLDMEAHSRAHAAPLPMDEDIKSVWSGIGFRIADHRLVAPIEYVREIMKYPTMSSVPGSKQWVKGIANIRGNLLPVFDLHGFLDESNSDIKRETRVLTVANDQVTAGLVVDEIFGMKYFDQGLFDSNLGYDVNWKEFFGGGYELDGENWVVFNIRRLIEDKDFLNVAV
jgi:twitching motility protein PilI